MPTIDLYSVERSTVTGLRVLLGVSGLLALVIGVLVLVWPAKTAVVVAGIICVYAFIAGVINIFLGIMTRRLGAWPRVSYVVLGIVFIVVAVLALTNLQAATAALAVLLGVTVGIAWIIEGIVSLTMLGDSASKVWTILMAVVSILAGIGLLLSPIWGAAVLWMLLGASLAVLGVVQIVRAIRFGAHL
ncbi:HdeD family acid-resistance protein [Granulicoccus phenolivorans]|uniref:HdeD family acid-resistance protein n=1 Tax=Granulicoccus phenolivorans TaxID=266854 RepID=UPI0004111F73|nr:DUF308 domain-containing protein [Granulicoccus phenolivorans]